MREINLAREALLAYVEHDQKADSTCLPAVQTNRLGGRRPDSGRYSESGHRATGSHFRRDDLKEFAGNPARIRSRELVKAADTWLKRGRFSRSLEACNLALSFDRANATAFNRRGVVFKATGRYSQAIKDFSRAIRIEPDYVAAIVNRGGTYCDLSQYDRAMADYDCAVRIDPEDARTYRSRARLLFKTRHYDRAIEDMRRALAL